MLKLMLTIIFASVCLGLAIWFLTHSITDDERLIDYERIGDLKDKARFEMTYFGRVSDDTLSEIEELERKYDN